MLGALKVYARAKQGTIVTPFILAGAMSPVTVAGTLAQVLAEVLAGAALTQLCRPGAPVLMGCFAASISMQSGAPTFGTPEPSLVSYGAAQLARRLGIPFRTGGGLVRLEGRRRAGGLRERQHAEHDAARRHQFRAARRRLARRRALLRLREIRHGLRPARHAAALRRGRRPHRERPGALRHPRGRAGLALSRLRSTRRTNFETAFYRSTIADNNSFEQWLAEGEKTAEQRANPLWKKWLAEYEAPPLDPGIDEALQDFIAKKKASMPDAFA